MAKNDERKIDAAKADMADTRENVGLGRDDHIRMDVKRSARFTDALCDLECAIETLAGAARTFEKRTISSGTIDPETLVVAMTDKMRKVSALLWSMTNAEEHIDHPEDAEADHGT
jgi:hypothetical protein